MLFIFRVKDGSENGNFWGLLKKLGKIQKTTKYADKVYWKTITEIFLIDYVGLKKVIGIFFGSFMSVEYAGTWIVLVS